MKLVSLYIHRLPGLREPIAIDTFGAGINVVTGPNASGKSSLLRALRLLLAPRPDDPGNLMLEAVFSDADHRWHTERVGRDVIWQRDGVVHTPPALPDAEALGGYFLPIDELLQMTRSDRTVVAHLRRELAGGYDLPALQADGGPLAVHPRRDRHAADALGRAEQQLRTAEAGNRELLAKRERLPELEEAIRRAGDALRRAEHCGAAVALVDAREATREAQARLQQFPEIMPEGIEAGELERLEQNHDRERQIAKQAHAQAAAALQRVQATGLADCSEGQPDIPAMRRRLEELRELTAHLNQAREETYKAASRAREAASLLGSEPPASPALEQHTMARLEEAAQDMSQALAAWHQAQAEADAQAAREQAAEGAAAQRSPWRNRAAIMLVCAGVGALAYNALAAQPALTLIAAILCLGALGWLAWQSERSMSRATMDPGFDERMDAARSRLERARAQLHELAAATGLTLDPETLPHHFQLLVQRTAKWDEALLAQREAEARCRQLVERVAPLGTALADSLRRWDVPPESSAPAELGRALDQLDQRLETAAEARRTRTRALEQAERAEAAAREAAVALDRLYRRAGLEPGERETLLARLHDLPAWYAAREAMRNATVREDAARERLADAPADLLERAEADDRAALREQLHLAEAAADEHPRLLREQGEILQALREAQRQLRLEEARAARDQAREMLAERLDQRMVAEAARFLLNDVEQHHRRDQQPEAIRLADQRLRRFTHDAFTLEINGAGEPCARESATGSVRDLDALSVGTRMQLLIALRMAWVEQQEGHHVPLPLLLDEALTTTDPRRFDAVANTLHALTREEGRQLLYLTAQPEDVQRWLRATGERPHVIDLTRLQGPTPPALTLSEPEAVSPPDGHNAASYAELLGVTAINPLADAGSLHLLYVLDDDLPFLYRLLTDFRLETVGQAESFLQGPLAGRHLDNAELERLQRRILAARAWVDAWRIGRGTPVDRPALEQSTMSNWKHLDALAERAASVGGDPKAFLDSLREDRIPGVGDKRIEQIADWLADAGLLDPRRPLSRTERYHYVLGRLPGHRQAVADAQQVTAVLEAAAAPAGAEARPTMSEA
ncbi:AAA family ATPase [Aquisalimonas sp.]|uniref:ATP-binding protein n=1 Tax=Aquisalimonas sp. TaxID=1872621 RepID=UPI0025BF6249|nr:AAA family ATPase [Aquisalimonas sp.]